jgi:copper chaperone
MTTITYSIPNINCNHCVHTVTTEISELAGVVSVDADLTNKQAVVIFEPPADDEKIRSLLTEINYPAAN